MNQPVFYSGNEPLLNGNEKTYLVECIRTGWNLSEGPFIKKFDEQIAGPADRKNGGHGFEMLDASEIIEVKQGPYEGNEDKTRFEPVDTANLRMRGGI